MNARPLRRSVVVVAICSAMFTVSPARAQVSGDGAWAALASDRVAARTGDSLTVVVSENAQATNTAQQGSKKATHAGGQLTTTGGHVHSADLSLAGGFDGTGQNARTDRMVAQVSVVVSEVLPNGDLLVAGEERLQMNGQHSRIRVRGRVRPADISSANTVLSSRLADAQIDYDGAGFVSRAAQPGLFGRLLDKLGLF